MAALLAAFGPLAAEDRKGTGASALVGDYTMVSGRRGGKAIAADKIKGNTVHISPGRIVVSDKDSKQTYVASYKVDTSMKPWRISMTSEVASTRGTKAEGLIEKSGDTVRLIYALPGGGTPTSFSAKDEKHIMVVLKGAKK